MAPQKEGELFGFIFMCSGVTKPECYLNRVFGLPAARREVVEKIKPGTKLFLFDFEAKLLYGVYEAASKGGMNLHPSAFGGRFPAQMRFKICNNCLPLPVSSFRTAIKDNYQCSKFTPELNSQQVRDLLLLFKPIVAPSTTSLRPAADYAAPKTQMLALVPNGVRGPRMPAPPSNGMISSSVTPYPQNCYRPYQVGPLHNCSQQITQSRFVWKNELNPHLQRPTPHQAPPAPVNPYEFADNQPPSNGMISSSVTPYPQNCYRPYQVGPLHNCSQQITQSRFVWKNELNPHLHRPTPHQAPPAPVNPYEFADNQPPYLSSELYSRYRIMPEVDPRDHTVCLDGEHSALVLQPVQNHVDGCPQGHNSYTIPKSSYVSPQGPLLMTQPSYSDPIYKQSLQYVLSTSMLQLIGVSNEEADFPVNTTPITKMTSKERKKASRKRRKALKKRKKALKGTSGLSMLDFRLTKSKTFGESSKIKRREKDKTGTYGAVLFISSGKMEFEPEVTSFDESKPRHQTPISSSYGAFETHTTGFGSKMLAKMGFVDGGGLGKDGRGIAEPIQVIERPKLLGLGAMAPEI